MDHALCRTVAPRVGTGFVGRGFRIAPVRLCAPEAAALVPPEPGWDPGRLLADRRARRSWLRRAVLWRAVENLVGRLGPDVRVAYVREVVWHGTPVAGDTVAPAGTVECVSGRGGRLHLTIRGEILARGGRRLATFRVGVDVDAGEPAAWAPAFDSAA